MSEPEMRDPIVDYIDEEEVVEAVLELFKSKQEDDDDDDDDEKESVEEQWDCLSSTRQALIIAYASASGVHDLEQYQSLDDMVWRLERRNGYFIYPGCKERQEAAREYLFETGCFDNCSDQLMIDYFDFERYGRKALPDWATCVRVRYGGFDGYVLIDRNM